MMVATVPYGTRHVRRFLLFLLDKRVRPYSCGSDRAERILFLRSELDDCTMSAECCSGDHGAGNP